MCYYSLRMILAKMCLIFDKMYLILSDILQFEAHQSVLFKVHILLKTLCLFIRYRYASLHSPGTIK